jgi:uncharacterized protein YqgV (UPF0045/DUF77 family)
MFLKTKAFIIAGVLNLHDVAAYNIVPQLTSALGMPTTTAKATTTGIPISSLVSHYALQLPVLGSESSPHQQLQSICTSSGSNVDTPAMMSLSRSWSSLLTTATPIDPWSNPVSEFFKSNLLSFVVVSMLIIGFLALYNIAIVTVFFTTFIAIDQDPDKETKIKEYLSSVETSDTYQPPPMELLMPILKDTMMGSLNQIFPIVSTSYLEAVVILALVDNAEGMTSDEVSKVLQRIMGAWNDISVTPMAGVMETPIKEFMDKIQDNDKNEK